jgi:hypothetical protein
MSLKPNIKRVLSIIQKAVGQAPLDKQPLLNNKVARVVDKHQKLSEANEPAFLKELEFNLNFIRLSFPHLDYTPPTEEIDPETVETAAEEMRARE